jgi:hypothetical protein
VTLGLGDMRYFRCLFFFLFLLIASLWPSPGCFAGTLNWKTLDPGLTLGLVSDSKSESGNGAVIILRIDPAQYSFKLMSASEHGGKPRTARQWCEEFHLKSAINASMFLDSDVLKSTGLMRNYGHENNPRINASFGAFFAFNPKDASQPPIRMIDRHIIPDWKKIINRYHTVIQNYRMISDGRKRGWPQQEEKNSMAVIGMDENRHVLFIFSRKKYTPHDFIKILLDLDIGINEAMYTEGGTEATLFISAGSVEMEFSGLNETDFKEVYGAGYGWPIPNMIGIVGKEK